MRNYLKIETLDDADYALICLIAVANLAFVAACWWFGVEAFAE
jgi:hypothetical protein